ncbi:hypothetical protein BGZ58_009688 [Dissophora ornata]|nr:hypothetical protein BGZ58_009688 [Dissophora ornata]
MTLDKESSLHSFVLDQGKSILGRFEVDDRALLKEVLGQDNSQEQELAQSLPKWKQHELARFLLAPDELWDLLRRGWGHHELEDTNATVDQTELDGFRASLHATMLNLAMFYKNHNSKLPESQSESW